MRHKYPTEAIVLSRAGAGEESAFLTLLTKDLGLVRARAQGIRKPGAKLAPALATLSESDVILVAGKEGWRVSGALLRTNWFTELPKEGRLRAGKVAGLLLRLIHGETPDERLFAVFHSYLAALSCVPEELHDAAECLAALHLLALLGLDAGSIPGTEDDPFSLEALAAVRDDRRACVLRVNRGLAASGL